MQLIDFTPSRQQARLYLSISRVANPLCLIRSRDIQRHDVPPPSLRNTFHMDNHKPGNVASAIFRNSNDRIFVPQRTPASTLGRNETLREASLIQPKHRL